MSPFLAQVNIINLAGDAQSPTATTSPGAPDNPTDAVAELRANAAQLKAKIIEKTQRDVARQLKEQSEEKDEDESDRASSHHGGSASFIVHTGKSKDGNNDAVFAAIPIVAIVFTFLYLIVRALMAPFNNRNKRGTPAQMCVERLSEEETALLEKLQRTLAQMEARVESLETILIDTARTKEKYGTKL